MLADIDNFVAGVNGFIRKSGLQIPAWTRNDFVASAALIGGIFGVAGGDEVRRSEYLSALEKQFGAVAGRTVWDDLRQVKAADSPVSVPGTFSYGEASGSAMPGNAVIYDGSFEPYEPGGPKLAKSRSLSMSNALLVGAKKSVSKYPIFVAGPQVGYFWPEFFVELDLHGGGIDTRGASFPGIGYVVVGRGKDYAWSAMSSHSDIVDQFVETLCGGDDLHYLYKGECRAMGTSTRACSRVETTSPTSGSSSTRPCTDRCRATPRCEARAWPSPAGARPTGARLPARSPSPI